MEEKKPGELYTRILIPAVIVAFVLYLIFSVWIGLRNPYTFTAAYTDTMESSALAQGDFSLMGQGRMALAYLGAEPDVVAGDLIVTSGLGGYYPSQVVIGYVEEVRTGDDGLTQYAVLRPEMSLEGLTEIFVVTSFDIVE